MPCLTELLLPKYAKFNRDIAALVRAKFNRDIAAFSQDTYTRHCCTNTLIFNREIAAQICNAIAVDIKFIELTEARQFEINIFE